MYHRFLTAAQFYASYAPKATDLQSAARALRSYGFKTTITPLGIVADAPRETVERVFRLHLRERTNAERFRIPELQADRAPTLPPELSKVHARVIAFPPVPHLKPMSAMASKTPIEPNNRYGATSPFYWFDDLKQAYSYPSYAYANGAGRTTAVVEASDFLDSDVEAYFGHEGLASPNIVRVAVDGGPGPVDVNSGLFVEASLDVQQIGGSAPGATIRVYQAPVPSLQSFYDMYLAIDLDALSGTPVDVVSASFGLCELYFLPSYNGGLDFTSILTQDFHDLFLVGNALGVTFVTGSGDNGAQGGFCTDPSGANAVVGVSSWADDPNVTGVGGTNLMTSSIPGSLQSTYIRENAFPDAFLQGQGFANSAIWASGGGTSVIFGKPDFQSLVNTGATTRSVPDLAMMMGGCPAGTGPPCGNKNPNHSAFITAINGGFYLLIGTSGSSPDFAGLQAIQNQVLGSPAGNANELIYYLAALGSVGNGPIFHNNIPGNNGYKSHQGYNFVVGNGTPYGAQYALSPFAPLAGNPQTPSNP
jgi:subtilase family serine protease